MICVQMYKDNTKIDFIKPQTFANIITYPVSLIFNL